MNKNEFHELKEFEIQEVLTEIHELYRARSIDLKFFEVISNLFLVLIYKRFNNEEFIRRYLEEDIKDETTKIYLKKVLSKIDINDLKELTNKYSEEKLKAAILFSDPDRFSEIDTISTHEGISNLALNLLDIGEGDIVLDMGSGVNSFLIQAGMNQGNVKCIGIEINTESLVIANIRSIICNLDIDVIQGNIISQDFSRLKANKIFSNPPLGMRWANIEKEIRNNKKLEKHFRDTKRTISGDWAYALSALLNQEELGRTVIIMTNAGTWNKPDEEIRRYLLEKGLIEGVITLPKNIFSFSSMDLTMMIFSKSNKEIHMVDASNLFTEGRRINTLETEDINNIIHAYNNHSEISRLVNLEEIKHQEYIINPNRYVGEEIKIENPIKLGEVCKIINRGAMISSKELDELVTTDKTNNQYLMLQNIKDGEIDDNLPYLMDIDENYDRYCIKNKNLIISKISPFKVALVNFPEDRKILANGNLYFIELDEERINPIFLENFLQSELGMSQLNKYAKGAVMKSISIRDLKEIQIPNIPISKQNEIGDEIKLLNEELIVLRKQADIIKDKKVKLIQEEII